MSQVANPSVHHWYRARNLVAAAAGVVVIAVLVFWFVTAPQEITANVLGPHTPNLANGRTMFMAGDCSACHARPRQDDPNRLGGGLALVSKFGTFYAPNISPDVKDGIGGWTEAQFVTAMRRGVDSEGEHLYPIFPYTSFQRMTNDDVRDLFAYMKTLPAVSGSPPEPQLAFPYNIRRLMGGWKLLYLDGKSFTPDPQRSAEWNRGAYLVNGPTHCAECHSPRNAFGAIEEGKRFAGNPNTYGVLGFPNITHGNLKKWTVEDMAEFLKTGLTPDGDRVGGPMTEVVRSTAQLSEADRKAMAVYLQSLVPITSSAAQTGGPRE